MRSIRYISRVANLLALIVVTGLLFCVGCVKTAAPTSPAASGGGQTAAGELKGKISIEGSSTVFPISQAMGVDFEGKYPGVQVTVAGNGTGTGFKRFGNREVEICDASRPISESEIATCKKNGLEYLELQVAIDGLTVVVNKDNDWVDTMTVAELKKIWDQGSTVKKWSDVKPEWPDRPIELFGAGTESGTFDYFTEVINGKAKQSRPDYQASENDNILVSGVVGSKFALGYFGFAYFVGAADKLKAVKIAAVDGAEGVAPTPSTVLSGEYKPLSRPLFIYVDKEALKRPEVAGFVEFYLSDEGQAVVEKRKYVRMNPESLTEMRQRLAVALKSN